MSKGKITDSVTTVTVRVIDPNFDPHKKTANMWRIWKKSNRAKVLARRRRRHNRNVNQ